MRIRALKGKYSTLTRSHVVTWLTELPAKDREDRSTT